MRRRLLILLIPLCLILPRVAFAVEVRTVHDGLADLVELADTILGHLDRLEAMSQQLDANAGTVGGVQPAWPGTLAQLEHVGTVLILELHPSDGYRDHAIDWLVISTTNRAKPPRTSRVTTDLYADCSRARPRHEAHDSATRDGWQTRRAGDNAQPA